MHWFMTTYEIPGVKSFSRTTRFADGEAGVYNYAYMLYMLPGRGSWIVSQSFSVSVRLQQFSATTNLILMKLHWNPHYQE